jgi:hypothetical protein
MNEIGSYKVYLFFSDPFCFYSMMETDETYRRGVYEYMKFDNNRTVDS